MSKRSNKVAKRGERKEAERQKFLRKLKRQAKTRKYMKKLEERRGIYNAIARPSTTQYLDWVTDRAFALYEDNNWIKGTLLEEQVNWKEEGF